MGIASILSLAWILSPPPSMDIGWLEGHWCGVANGTHSEEIWTGSGHGLAVGLHKDLKADGGAAFEFMRIEVRGGEATFFGQPAGVAATAFKAIHHDARALTFENATHDYPRRIGYERVDDDTLTAWIDGGEGTKATRWTWTRCASSPTGR